MFMYERYALHIRYRLRVYENAVQCWLEMVT